MTSSRPFLRSTTAGGPKSLTESRESPKSSKQIDWISMNSLPKNSASFFTRTFGLILNEKIFSKRSPNLTAANADMEGYRQEVSRKSSAVLTRLHGLRAFGA